MIAQQIVLFIHILSAMILLGLPLSFSRFTRSMHLVDDAEIKSQMARHLLFLVNTYLNGSMFVLLLTGFHMIGKTMALINWPHLSGILVLMVFDFLCINLILGSGLRKIRDQVLNPEDGRLMLGLRMRYFSMTHHTTISLIVLLMVMRVMY